MKMLDKSMLILVVLLFLGSFADNAHCQFDYLEIRQDGPSGRKLGKFCGTRRPRPIAAKSNVIWINMITDKSDTMAGFRATWETIDSGPGGLSSIYEFKSSPFRQTEQ